MYQKSITHYIAKIVVDILFYVSIVCTLLVPFLVRWLFGWIEYGDSGYLTVFAVILFVSGLCCVYILLNLKQMYHSLLEGDPFTDKNVRHLRKMSVVCFLMAVIYFGKCTFMFTLATIVIAVIFVVGCLFCLTLKDLFKQAINYKTENELTI